MKTIGVVCTLAIASSLAAQAQAGGAATVTEHETASALANAETQITCDDGSTATVSTSIAVTSRVESVRGTGGPSNAASLAIDWFEFNPCTGQLRHTVRLIESPDSDHDGLRSAAVTGSFELTDVTIPVGTVAIELEWSGTGPVTRTSTHDSTETDDATVITASQEGRRSASLSGSVMLDDIELTLSSPGELVTDRTLEITLPR